MTDVNLKKFRLRALIKTILIWLWCFVRQPRVGIQTIPQQPSPLVLDSDQVYERLKINDISTSLVLKASFEHHLDVFNS